MQWRLTRPAGRRSLALTTALASILVIAAPNVASAHCVDAFWPDNEDVAVHQHAGVDTGTESTKVQDRHFDSVLHHWSVYNHCYAGHVHNIFWNRTNPPPVNGSGWQVGWVHPMYFFGDDDTENAKYLYQTRLHWFSYDMPAGSGPCWGVAGVMWHSVNHKGAEAFKPPASPQALYYGRHRHDYEYEQSWINGIWVCNP